ncbi:MAG: vWA domain-containing protein [Frankiaceae bacterium]
MPSGLVDRAVALAGALRRAGIAVSVAETLDAARVLAVVPLLDREALRAGLAAACCKRAAHRESFDRLFDLCFPAATGDPAGTVTPEEPALPPRPGQPDPLRDELRERLLQGLVDGDDEAVRGLAREAVAAMGQGQAQGGRSSWFGYRVLRRVAPETLVARLLDAMLGDAPRGGLAERVARQVAAERIRAFEDAVDAEVRRRLAEERGADAIAPTAVRPPVEEVDFLRAGRAELDELRRQVQPLARRLATRLAARRHHRRSGRLDFRRTMRASLAAGGVPVVTRHRPPRPHKPDLVLLCDVSGSVAGFAHFTLLLTAALSGQFTRVRSFAFVDTCDEVTRFFAGNPDPADAVRRMTAAAQVVWFDGHSDYGHAFEVLAERWPDAVTPRTSLLVLGDGRTNYRSPGLPVLRRLVAESRHAYWLNPEPRAQWGSGDSAALAYADVVEMVECRNAAQLSGFVAGLLPAG